MLLELLLLLLLDILRTLVDLEVPELLEEEEAEDEDDDEEESLILDRITPPEAEMPVIAERFLEGRTVLEERLSSGHRISLEALEYLRETPALRATTESGFQSLKWTDPEGFDDLSVVLSFTGAILPSGETK